MYISQLFKWVAELVNYKPQESMTERTIRNNGSQTPLCLHPPPRPRVKVDVGFAQPVKVP